MGSAKSYFFRLGLDFLKTFKHFFSILKDFRLLPSFSPPRVLKEKFAFSPRKSSGIPNVVYQTWVSRYVGRSHFNAIQSFRKANIDFSFVLFDDYEVDLYMSKHWSTSPIYVRYQLSPPGPMKIDIFRYCLLFDRGGYYFDIKSGFLNSLKSMDPNSSNSFLFWEENSYEPIFSCSKSEALIGKSLVAQWGIGFTPHHAFLKELLSQISKVPTIDFENVKSKADVLSLTGPIAFTNCLHGFVCGGGEININEFSNSVAVYELPGSQCRFIQKTSYTKVFK